VRAFLDAALSGLARVMAFAFFRSVEVSGRSSIPHRAPLLIVANHANSLADPLLLMAFVDGRSRFLAKSTLWSHPVIGPLLVLVGALPVYRHRDAGQDVGRNISTFARCHLELRRGGSIALFPEGTSHNLPHRLPLKTGAARIALEAAASGASGLLILPVGLVYEAKGRFRSRVLINIGAPIDPGPEARTFETKPREAVVELTARIARGLEGVTTSYESWDEARLLNLAAAVIGASNLGERFTRSRAFLAALRELRARDPERVARLTASVERYEQHLRDLSLFDEDVAVASGRSRARLDLVLHLPLGFVGAFLNFIPYQVTGWVTRRFARTPDEPATYMLMTALLAFPSAWLALGISGWVLGGPIAGALAMVLAAASGVAALRLREAFQLLRRPQPTQGLLRQREALAETIRQLAGSAV
jgi:1-acyl-sn-glycerol-3-phosphate acyltransferase